MNIVQTSELTKQYHEQLSVHNLNLSIEEGQIYGFLGPNGAGKTTTIKMILGLIKPSKGKVFVFRKEMNKNNRSFILNNIGAIVESPSSYNHLTAYENLKIICNLTNCNKNNIDEVLKIVRLKDVKHKLVKTFSLGMKQRLGIAAALIKKPKLLILDEPTNGLDPAGIQEIRELIKSLPRLYNSTVLISSHILSEIDQIASHVGIISKGNLVYEGKIEDLRKKSHKKIKLRTDNLQLTLDMLKSKMNIVGDLCNEMIELDYYDDAKVAQIILKLVNEGMKIYRIEEEKVNLENIFFQLTGKEISL